MFQMTILKVESDQITATEASQAYEELVIKLEERKANNFIPFAAKQLQRKLKMRKPLMIRRKNFF